MHIRPKPWARPELESCGFFETNPKIHCEKWQSLFLKPAPLHLEMGCGKGLFISQLASKNPSVNYLAIDLIDAVLGLAKRTIDSTYFERNIPIDNIRLTSWDIERIHQIISPKDQVERIYINFCNPWPKRRHQKKRLTHSKQLRNYQTFLKPQGEIHFKTDNDSLFEDSVHYLKESGFKISTLIRDLHQSSHSSIIKTEHEKMFIDQGIKIKFLIAVL